jgi:hypothetical protein
MPSDRKLRIEWKPQDCWLGVFWKRSRILHGEQFDVWVCVIPMLPVHYTKVTSDAQ